eukprot:3656518-Pyramimonas_sp.AAC.1
MLGGWPAGVPPAACFQSHGHPMMANIGRRLLIGIPRRSRRRAPPLQSSASFAASPHQHPG